VTLLNRHLGDTRQWFSFLFERSGISDYIYVWMPGNRQIVLNADAAGVIRLHVQPFTSWRRSYSRSPDHDLACDTLSADDNPVNVNLVNTMSPAHFYAKIFQPAFGRLGSSSASPCSNAFRTLLRMRTTEIAQLPTSAKAVSTSISCAGEPLYSPGNS